MNKNKSKKEAGGTQSFALLVGLFVAALLLTNVVTVKYFSAGGGLILTAGALIYPFTFSLIDIITELYGPQKAARTVWVGLVTSIFMMVVVQIASWVPASAHSPVDQATFKLVFGFTPGIVIGSMAAYLVAQFTDIYLFDLIRRLTGSNHLWLRNSISTLTSQLIDTLLFGLIVWILWPWLGWESSIAPLPWPTWRQMMVSEYLFKVAFTLVNMPLVYLGVYSMKRWGGDGA